MLNKCLLSKTQYTTLTFKFYFPRSMAINYYNSKNLKYLYHRKQSKLVRNYGKSDILKYCKNELSIPHSTSVRRIIRHTSTKKQIIWTEDLKPNLVGTD